MKKLTFLKLLFRGFILLVFVLDFGCSSDDDNNSNNGGAPESLIGSWIFDNPGTIERSVITFVDNTRFVLVDDGVADDDGQPGLERGTYIWDSTSGAFEASVTTDTSGGWGLSEIAGLGDITLTISGSTMTVTFFGESITFTKITSSNSNPIIGSWLFGVAGGTDSGVVTFIDGSDYVLGNDGVASLTGQPGIERGNYVWDMTSGAFSATASTNTDGSWGLVPNGEGTITINGNQMMYSIPGGADSIGTRIVE